MRPSGAEARSVLEGLVKTRSSSHLHPVATAVWSPFDGTWIAYIVSAGCDPMHLLAMIFPKHNHAELSESDQTDAASYGSEGIK